MFKSNKAKRYLWKFLTSKVLACYMEIEFVWEIGDRPVK